MADYYEIDLLEVHTSKSGDAISIRYEVSGQTYIHVVDGGYESTGQKLVDSINKYYGNPKKIDHVIVTHPDQDHACGVASILDNFEVGTLWLLRPWDYAQELLPRFSRYTNADNLARRLKVEYPYIANLSDAAAKKGITVREPFQGEMIGAFRVLAPSRSRYLDLVVESEKTPESVAKAQESLLDKAGQMVTELAKKAANLVKAAWGEEVFSTQETSAENEMSVVQWATLCGHKIVLTGDVGRSGLAEAADYAPLAGLSLPGVFRFQVPHHGSRRNVSTELLDRWLGERLPERPEKGSFSALISSAKEDTDHPRKSVIRALIHRGANVVTTEGRNVCSHSNGAPDRGWTAVAPEPYPEENETD